MRHMENNVVAILIQSEYKFCSNLKNAQIRKHEVELDL